MKYLFVLLLALIAIPLLAVNTFNNGIVSKSPVLIGNKGVGQSYAASALLELYSTSKGLMLPRMSTVQRNAISPTAAGMIIFDVNTNKFNGHNGTAWGDLTPLSAISPLSLTSGTISAGTATASVNGILASSDWTIFNNKQNTLSAISPITISSSTISAGTASASTDGILTSTDWTIFNNKQGTLTTGSISGTNITVGGTPAGSVIGNGVTLSIPQSIATNATPTFASTILTNSLGFVSNSQTTKLQGNATATASVAYQLPAADGSPGNALLTDGGGILSWGAPSAEVSITGGAGVSISGAYTISANVSSPSMAAIILASGYINSDGTIGRQDANWITAISHDSGAGTYGITFSAGLFSVAPNCQANARDSISYKATVGTASTGGVNITTANLSAATVSSAFTVECVGKK